MAELSAEPRLARSRDLAGEPRKGGRSQRQREGQQATAAGLDLLRVLGWLVLHDVAFPGNPGLVVDHVLAGPSGVYVVNTVTWSGPINVADGVLTVGKTDRSNAVAETAAAADVVRSVLGGTPVAPLLCFERLEAVAGVAGDVALCASENILDLLTGQREILDGAAVARASRSISGALHGEAVAPTPGPTLEELVRSRALADAGLAGDAQPEADPLVEAGHAPRGLGRALRRSRRNKVEESTPGQLCELPVPEPVIAPSVESVAESVADSVAESVVERIDEVGVLDAPGAEPMDFPGSSAATASAVVQPSAAVAEAGAALWRTLTGTHEVEDAEVEDAGAEVEQRQVGTGVVEEQPESPAAWEQDMDLDLQAEREAHEARARAAREALERAAREALEAEAREHAEAEERERLVSAEAEERQRAEHEARERAERERLEHAARELAAAEEQERIEREARERATAEERDRREREARENAERERLEQQAERERSAEETHARAAWEARLHASREARTHEAHENPVRAAEERERIEALRLRQPDVRRGEVLEPEPSGSESDEVDLETWEPALDQTMVATALEVDAEEDHVEVVQPARVVDERREAPETPPSAGPSLRGPHAARPRRRRRRVRLPRRADDHDEKASGTSLRAIAHVAVGALLIAGVIVGAPRVHGVVTWAKQRFAADPATSVGMPVKVDATSFHPSVEVLAGTPVDAHATGAGKGNHLVAVPLRLHNTGTSAWTVPVGASATVVDDLGVVHRTATGVKAGKAYPLLPSRPAVAPGQDLTGYVVFAVPDGRTLRSVSLGLSASDDHPVTWQVAP